MLSGRMPRADRYERAALFIRLAGAFSKNKDAKICFELCANEARLCAAAAEAGLSSPSKRRQTRAERLSPIARLRRAEATALRAMLLPEEAPHAAKPMDQHKHQKTVLI